jgi:hypothetical protein
VRVFFDKMGSKPKPCYGTRVQNFRGLSISTSRETSFSKFVPQEGFLKSQICISVGGEKKEN